MMRLILMVGMFAILPGDRAGAIEYLPLASYNTTAPTAANIDNWNSGWVQPATEPTGYTSTTGWNYVGMVNGASAVYLGKGWVITAAHVGGGSLALNGVTYPMVANSASPILTNGTGRADLVVFRISPCPDLPPLPLSSSDPVPYSGRVALIGYGASSGTRAETWGYNTVTPLPPEVQQPLPLNGNGMAYLTFDFWTFTGFSSSQGQSATNNYVVVVGDSGGGDFIYNPTTKLWELAGINEVIITYTNGSTASGFVQLDAYAAQIAQIMAPPTDTPALPEWALLVLGAALVLLGAPRTAGRV